MRAAPDQYPDASKPQGRQATARKTRSGWGVQAADAPAASEGTKHKCFFVNPKGLVAVTKGACD